MSLLKSLYRSIHRNYSSVFKVPHFNIENDKKENSPNNHSRNLKYENDVIKFPKNKNFQKYKMDKRKCTDSRITSNDNPKYKNSRKNDKLKSTLDTRRSNLLNVNKNNNEILFGVFPVLGAVEAKRRTLFNCYYKEGRRENNKNVALICDLCESQGITCHTVSKTFLNKIAGDDAVNQGICLEASPLPDLCVDDCNAIERYLQMSNSKNKINFWIYLNQIHDPMNLGALIRTSSYLGVSAMIHSATNSCPISSIVSKASAGAAESFPVFKSTNEEDFFTSCKREGWQIVSSLLDARESIDIHDFEPSNKVILIVGNEATGVSEKLLNMSDNSISIRSTHHCHPFVQSLNVSVASSILMYSLINKMKKK